MDSEPPGAPKAQAPKKEAPGTQSGWRYVGLGVQLAVTVAVFVWLGWWLDSRFGWSPWGMCVLGLLGVAAGLYHFLKDAMP